MQIKNCQPILGLTKYCKPITGFKSLTCKLFLGRNRQHYSAKIPACRQAGFHSFHRLEMRSIHEHL